MMWILIMLGCVLGLVALVFLVGSLLPERYGARGYVDVDESAEELWPKLLDHRAHPMAAKMAKGVEDLPDENGLPVWLESLGPSKIRVHTVFVGFGKTEIWGGILSAMALTSSSVKTGRIIRLP